MSWMHQLYETYEKHKNEAGKVNLRHNQQEYTLLPVAHTTQNAHIEVAVTFDGEFHSAEIVYPEQANTTIPTTESSASRSGKKIAPYPLHDKLSYCAGDYAIYGDSSKATQFEAYIKQLKEWKDWDDKNEKLTAIYTYIAKKRLIQDLIKTDILQIDKDHKLYDKKKESSEEKSPLLKILPGGQDAAFVRFYIYSPTMIEDPLWKDHEMFQSFSDYYETKLLAEDICFITGEKEPRTERHANKIRNAADKGKLISANDSVGFTYRGRFTDANQVAGISYNASQKMHNALKWLIRRQGRTYDGRVFIAWSPGWEDPEEPLAPGFDIFEEESEAENIIYTNEEYATKFALAMEGKTSKLDPKAKVNLIVLDAATTGRLAVLYYQVLAANQYGERIAHWHAKCAWRHTYKNREGERYHFWGAPSIYDIGKAVYGQRADDKVIKETIIRLLPCVTENQPLPLDIIRRAIQQASNPVSMEKWEWERSLSTACALINEREGKSVALEKDNTSRDYLFGRLLAVADVLERRALGREENRATNAIRYMNSFSKHPERTWKTIQESIQPYQAKLGRKASDLQKILDEIGSKLKPEDFTNKPLSGMYLIGFYSQRHALYETKQSEKKGEDVQ